MEEVLNFDPPNADVLACVPKDLNVRVPVPPKVDGKATPASAWPSCNLNQNPKISRIDLYQKLLDIYNSERLRWVRYKNDARPHDMSKQDEADAYDGKSAVCL